MKPVSAEHKRVVNNRRNREYYGRMNPEERRARDRARYAKHAHIHRERQRRHRFKSRYGITIQEFDLLMLFQDGQCALCEKALDGDLSHGSIHVDHCHETGKIRGVVHRACNLMLGYARDNPETLQRAITYLCRAGIVSITPDGIRA